MAIKSSVSSYGIDSIPDYCNDINAAWPIMVKYKISPSFGSLFYGACECDSDLDHENENVIRAAMIVYLQIPEGKSDE